MNKVCLVARLTAKPELRYTEKNTAFTRFTVAVNSGYGDNQKTDFINILAWKNQAENVCKYLDKGSLVSIEGRIQTGSYKDKDGNNRYSFDVVAESVEFLESKKEGQAVSPKDFENKTSITTKELDEDPFAEFGETVSLDDSDLD